MEKDVNAMPGEAAGGSEGLKKASLSDELATRRTDLAAERTDMAIARTSMAADRTLMSWVRTSLSLMSFGFTIYKFLTYIIQLPGNSATQLSNPEGPLQLGIIMIGSSLLCVILGMIEYHDIWKRFGKQQHQKLWGTSIIMAVLTALLALLLLLAIITKIGGL
jgi:putative membrane protein